MGCVHGKCCTQYPNSSRGDKREIHENGDNNIHPNGNHEYTESSSALIVIPSHKYKLEYCALTQRGYYPDSPDKENQDSFCVRTRMLSNPNLHFFGVFDGHGQFGTQCSHFVRDRLVEVLSEDPVLIEDPVKAYESAFLATNSELHDSEIDDSMSGTTAITVLVCEDILFIGNVGDSRAVLGVKNGDRVIAEDLSSDQTPFRKDEYERVKLCGARVLSVDQVEGVKDPDIQAWGDEESDGGDPPRLWVQNGMYPGTAFTRSVGDSTAEKIGVVAVPEVSMVRLTPEHLFFVIASDGVFEFLSSQAVVDTVLKYSDPKDACAAIARESYKLWLEHENRTDDISIIIVRIKDLHNNNKSEQEWRAILSPEQFRILRQKGTESPGTGEYDKFSSDGIYNCAGCGTPLYKATTKFNSGCGWPAFFDGLPGAISRTGDRDGRRIEITCTACGGHLGHVFKGEGFNTPTDERHCVNSVSLKFVPEST